MAKIAILRYFRFIAVLLALAVLGCAPQHIKNVSNAPVQSSKANLTLDDVGNAIKRAGTGLGWGMKEDSPGSITGTLLLRTHRAVVVIKYDTKSYSIDYADSTNLKYNDKTQMIHKNYNGCIQNLDAAIKTNLVNLT